MFEPDEPEAGIKYSFEITDKTKWQDVPLQLWAEHFNNPEKKRNRKLTKIFEKEFFLLKSIYCFLEKSQVVGRTLSKFGIPNICGQISKKFLQQATKCRKRANQSTKSVLHKIKQSKPTTSKPKFFSKKTLVSRYPPVASRCSNLPVTPIPVKTNAKQEKVATLINSSDHKNDKLKKDSSEFWSVASVINEPKGDVPIGKQGVSKKVVRFDEDNLCSFAPTQESFKSSLSYTSTESGNSLGGTGNEIRHEQLNSEHGLDKPKVIINLTGNCSNNFKNLSNITVGQLLNMSYQTKKVESDSSDTTINKKGDKNESEQGSAFSIEPYNEHNVVIEESSFSFSSNTISSNQKSTSEKNLPNLELKEKESCLQKNVICEEILIPKSTDVGKKMEKQQINSKESKAETNEILSGKNISIYKDNMRHHVMLNKVESTNTEISLISNTSANSMIDHVNDISELSSSINELGQIIQSPDIKQYYNPENKSTRANTTPFKNSVMSLICDSSPAHSLSGRDYMSDSSYCLSEDEEKTDVENKEKFDSSLTFLKTDDTFDRLGQRKGLSPTRSVSSKHSYNPVIRNSSVHENNLLRSHKSKISSENQIDLNNYDKNVDTESQEMITVQSNPSISSQFDQVDESVPVSKETNENPILTPNNTQKIVIESSESFTSKQQSESHLVNTDNSALEIKKTGISQDSTIKSQNIVFNNAETENSELTSKINTTKTAEYIEQIYSFDNIEDEVKYSEIITPDCNQLKLEHFNDGQNLKNIIYAPNKHDKTTTCSISPSQITNQIASNNAKICKNLFPNLNYSECFVDGTSEAIIYDTAVKGSNKECVETLVERDTSFECIDLKDGSGNDDASSSNPADCQTSNTNNHQNMNPNIVNQIIGKNESLDNSKKIAYTSVLDYEYSDEEYSPVSPQQNKTDIISSQNNKIHCSLMNETKKSNDSSLEYSDSVGLDKTLAEKIINGQPEEKNISTKFIFTDQFIENNSGINKNMDMSLALKSQEEKTDNNLPKLHNNFIKDQKLQSPVEIENLPKLTSKNEKEKSNTIETLDDFSDEEYITESEEDSVQNIIETTELPETGTMDIDESLTNEDSYKSEEFTANDLPDEDEIINSTLNCFQQKGNHIVEESGNHNSTDISYVISNTNRDMGGRMTGNMTNSITISDENNTSSNISPLDLSPLTEVSRNISLTTTQDKKGDFFDRSINPDPVTKGHVFDTKHVENTILLRSGVIVLKQKSGTPEIQLKYATDKSRPANIKKQLKDNKEYTSPMLDRKENIDDITDNHKSDESLKSGESSPMNVSPLKEINRNIILGYKPINIRPTNAPDNSSQFYDSSVDTFQVTKSSLVDTKQNERTLLVSSDVIVTKQKPVMSEKQLTHGTDINRSSNVKKQSMYNKEIASTMLDKELNIHEMMSMKSNDSIESHEISEMNSTPHREINNKPIILGNKPITIKPTHTQDKELNIHEMMSNRRSNSMKSNDSIESHEIIQMNSTPHREINNKTIILGNKPITIKPTHTQDKELNIHEIMSNRRSNSMKSNDSIESHEIIQMNSTPHREINNKTIILGNKPITIKPTHTQDKELNIHEIMSNRRSNSMKSNDSIESHEIIQMNSTPHREINNKTIILGNKPITIKPTHTQDKELNIHEMMSNRRSNSMNSNDSIESHEISEMNSTSHREINNKTIILGNKPITIKPTHTKDKELNIHEMMSNRRSNSMKSNDSIESHEIIQMNSTPHREINNKTIILGNKPITIKPTHTQDKELNIHEIMSNRRSNSMKSNDSIESHEISEMNSTPHREINNKTIILGNKPITIKPTHTQDKELNIHEMMSNRRSNSMKSNDSIESHEIIEMNSTAHREINNKTIILGNKPITIKPTHTQDKELNIHEMSNRRSNSMNSNDSIESHEISEMNSTPHREINNKTIILGNKPITIKPTHTQDKELNIHEMMSNRRSNSMKSNDSIESHEIIQMNSTPHREINNKTIILGNKPITIKPTHTQDKELNIHEMMSNRRSNSMNSNDSIESHEISEMNSTPHREINNKTIILGNKPIAIQPTHTQDKELNIHEMMSNRRSNSMNSNDSIESHEISEMNSTPHREINNKTIILGNKPIAIQPTHTQDKELNIHEMMSNRRSNSMNSNDSIESHEISEMNSTPHREINNKTIILGNKPIAIQPTHTQDKELNIHEMMSNRRSNSMNSNDSIESDEISEMNSTPHREINNKTIILGNKPIAIQPTHTQDKELNIHEMMSNRRSNSMNSNDSIESDEISEMNSTPHREINNKTIILGNKPITIKPTHTQDKELNIHEIMSNRRSNSMKSNDSIESHEISEMNSTPHREINNKTIILGNKPITIKPTHTQDKELNIHEMMSNRRSNSMKSNDSIESHEIIEMNSTAHREINNKTIILGNKPITIKPTHTQDKELNIHEMSNRRSNSMNSNDSIESHEISEMNSTPHREINNKTIILGNKPITIKPTHTQDKELNIHEMMSNRRSNSMKSNDSIESHEIIQMNSTPHREINNKTIILGNKPITIKPTHTQDKELNIHEMMSNRRSNSMNSNDSIESHEISEMNSTPHREINNKTIILGNKPIAIQPTHTQDKELNIHEMMSNRRSNSMNSNDSIESHEISEMNSTPHREINNKTIILGNKPIAIQPTHTQDKELNIHEMMSNRRSNSMNSNDSIESHEISEMNSTPHREINNKTIILGNKPIAIQPTHTQDKELNIHEMMSNRRSNSMNSNDSIESDEISEMNSTPHREINNKTIILGNNSIAIQPTHTQDKSAQFYDSSVDTVQVTNGPLVDTNQAERTILVSSGVITVTKQKSGTPEKQPTYGTDLNQSENMKTILKDSNAKSHQTSNNEWRTEEIPVVDTSGRISVESDRGFKSGESSPLNISPYKEINRDIILGNKTTHIKATIADTKLRHIYDSPVDTVEVTKEPVVDTNQAERTVLVTSGVIVTKHKSGPTEKQLTFAADKSESENIKKISKDSNAKAPQTSDNEWFTEEIVDTNGSISAKSDKSLKSGESSSWNVSPLKEINRNIILGNTPINKKPTNAKDKSRQFYDSSVGTVQVTKGPVVDTNQAERTMLVTSGVIVTKQKHGITEKQLTFATDKSESQNIKNIPKDSNANAPQTSDNEWCTEEIVDISRSISVESNKSFKSGENSPFNVSPFKQINRDIILGNKTIHIKPTNAPDKSRQYYDSSVDTFQVPKGPLFDTKQDKGTILVTSGVILTKPKPLTSEKQLTYTNRPTNVKKTFKADKENAFQVLDKEHSIHEIIGNRRSNSMNSNDSINSDEISQSYSPPHPDTNNKTIILGNKPINIKPTNAPDKSRQFYDSPVDIVEVTKAHVVDSNQAERTMLVTSGVIVTKQKPVTSEKQLTHGTDINRSSNVKKQSMYNKELASTMLDKEQSIHEIIGNRRSNSMNSNDSINSDEISQSYSPPHPDTNNKTIILGNKPINIKPTNAPDKSRQFYDSPVDTIQVTKGSVVDTNQAETTMLLTSGVIVTKQKPGTSEKQLTYASYTNQTANVKKQFNNDKEIASKMLDKKLNIHEIMFNRRSNSMKSNDSIKSHEISQMNSTPHREINNKTIILGNKPIAIKPTHTQDKSRQFYDASVDTVQVRKGPVVDTNQAERTMLLTSGVIVTKRKPGTSEKQLTFASYTNQTANLKKQFKDDRENASQMLDKKQSIHEVIGNRSSMKSDDIIKSHDIVQKHSLLEINNKTIILGNKPINIKPTNTQDKSRQFYDASADTIQVTKGPLVDTNEDERTLLVSSGVLITKLKSVTPEKQSTFGVRSTFQNVPCITNEYIAAADNPAKIVSQGMREIKHITQDFRTNRNIKGNFLQSENLYASDKYLNNELLKTKINSPNDKISENDVTSYKTSSEEVKSSRNSFICDLTPQEDLLGSVRVDSDEDVYLSSYRSSKDKYYSQESLEKDDPLLYGMYQNKFNSFLLSNSPDENNQVRRKRKCSSADSDEECPKRHVQQNIDYYSVVDSSQKKMNQRRSDDLVRSNSISSIDTGSHKTMSDYPSLMSDNEYGNIYSPKNSRELSDMFSEDDSSRSSLSNESVSMEH